MSMNSALPVEQSQMKMAIMGGTFNPIHFGHLRIAEETREAYRLDRVAFIPAFSPPHKPDETITEPGARLEMTRLATAENPGFEVSEIEISRGGSSYTVETLRELHARHPKGLSVSLIVGNDSFNDITTWCNYEEIFALASFIVVPRPGYPVKKVAEALPVELARKFWYDSDTGRYANSFGTTVSYFETTLFGISSSDIRRRVAEGRSIRYLVPPAVEEYIREKGLYRG